jgi:uncharacterized protein
MTQSLVMALGFVLVIEGLTYALVPRHIQNMMRILQDRPPEQLRVAGTVVLALGVFIVWLARL